MIVKITPNTDAHAEGKLADAELHFNEGVLDGLKLIGFGIWHTRAGQMKVTFPARQYAVNGEKRSFALLRPINDLDAQDSVRDLILDAWTAFKEGAS